MRFKLTIAIVLLIPILYTLFDNYQQDQKTAHHDKMFQEIREMFENHISLIEAVQDVMKKEEYNHKVIVRDGEILKRKYVLKDVVVSDPHFGDYLKLSDVFTIEEQRLILELFSLSTVNFELYSFEPFSVDITDKAGKVDLRVLYLGQEEEHIELWKHRSVRFEEVYDGWFAMIIDMPRF